jgi:hypothetical protein
MDSGDLDGRRRERWWKIPNQSARDGSFETFIGYTPEPEVSREK